LGLLSSESGFFAAHVKVLATLMQERGLDAVIKRLHNRENREHRGPQKRALSDEELQKQVEKDLVQLNIGQDDKMEEEGNMCVICEEEQITHSLLFCGHLDFCEKCATNLVGKLCPICRQPVDKTVRIYSGRR